MPNTFKPSIAGNAPARNVFNWNREKQFDMDIGELIPCGCEFIMPGTTIKFGNEQLVRLQPMVAPAMVELRIDVHNFFVPLRLLDENWETFVTGGEDGEYSVPPILWKGTNKGKWSLWDYMISAPVSSEASELNSTLPVAYPKIAYNLVFNQWYRDENLQDEVDLMQDSILFRNWSKDYFTSALNSLQRGVAPAFPVTFDVAGSIPALTLNGTIDVPVEGTSVQSTLSGGSISISGDTGYWTSNSANIMALKGSGNTLTVRHEEQNISPKQSSLVFGLNKPTVTNTVSAGRAKGTVSATGSGDINITTGEIATFDVSDLRRIVAIQRFMELNERAGVRYTEFIQAHYGVKNPDSRLQRAEYIGGTKSYIGVSEVLQTSGTGTGDTPQGTLAGKGISASRGYAGKYFASEFGIWLSIMSIMPMQSYGQGIDRQWLWKSRYDLPFPEFAFLSEQAVTRNEIFHTGTSSDDEVFGFQARFNEYRNKYNTFHGAFRDTYAYWHLGSIFQNQPMLNEDFISLKGFDGHRIFAVQPQARTEKDFIVTYGQICKAIQPIPRYGEPGLVDHVY